MQYYKPSGKVGIAPFFVIFCAVSAIPLLAYLYSICIFEVPYLALRWLLPIFFGVLAGAASNLAVLVYGKSRNMGFTMFCAVVLCLLFYYLHWIFYFIYVSDHGAELDFTALISKNGTDFFEKVLYLLDKPSLVYRMVKSYISTGLWSAFGIKLNGGIQIFILILEFLLIFLSTTIVTTLNSEIPFDELNNQWFRAEYLENRKYFLPEDQLVSRLESGQYRGLLVFDKNKIQPNEPGFHFSKYTLFTNGKQYYLTVENAVRKFENNAWTTKTTELVRYIKIPQDFAQELRAKNEKISLEKNMDREA